MYLIFYKRSDFLNANTFLFLVNLESLLDLVITEVCTIVVSKYTNSK